MKKLFLLLFALLAVTAANAQILKGDMNGDGKLTRADAYEIINTFLGRTKQQYFKTVDNSKILGTWYETKTKTVSFNADGTTDYISCYKYGYYPELKAILFFDKNGKLLSFRNILSLAEQNLSIDNQGVTVNYTRTKPVSKVTSITLSKTDLTIAPDGYEVLTATVLPADADDKSYTWKSSDESVVMIVGDGRLIPLKLGTCTITCTANDGSGVKATCTVIVSNTIGIHEAVDLGLSVKWATCNVGATKPEDYGDYYAWGETVGYNTSKKIYNWSTYKWCNGSETTMTKYCTSSSLGTVDNMTELELEDDAAYVNWGSNWRLPTRTELDELINTQNCTWTWITFNGVQGYEVKSVKNGNSIFLPAAGTPSSSSSSIVNSGVHGYYMSSTLNPSISSRDIHISSGVLETKNYYKYCGLSVRAVCR